MLNDLKMQTIFDILSETAEEQLLHRKRPCTLRAFLYGSTAFDIEIHIDGGYDLTIEVLRNQDTLVIRRVCSKMSSFKWYDRMQLTVIGEESKEGRQIICEVNADKQYVISVANNDNLLDLLKEACFRPPPHNCFAFFMYVTPTVAVKVETAMQIWYV